MEKDFLTTVTINLTSLKYFKVMTCTCQYVLHFIDNCKFKQYPETDTILNVYLCTGEWDNMDWFTLCCMLKAAHGLQVKKV